MSYTHIDNLYKNQDILLFRECWAMEKIHGTSAHISYNNGEVKFFAGGGKHEDFVALFDAKDLKFKFDNLELGDRTIIVYGESYGGKIQGMSKTYGNAPKFVVFEVKFNNSWLNVPQAEAIVRHLELEFVHYKKISTSLEEINAERDADSIQAIRNGMGEGHIREGIVLRPLLEMHLSDGRRVIAKHKRDEFKETRNQRSLDPQKLKVLTEARDIANEWVTLERLKHILDKVQYEITIENTGKIITDMMNDIKREAINEIIISPESRKEIVKSTALLYKKYLKSTLS